MERGYICVSESLWLKDMTGILRQEFSKYGYPVTRFTVGDWLIKLGGMFTKDLKTFVPQLNHEKKMDTSLSTKELGLVYRTSKETLVDMGYSLIKIGLVSDKINKKE